MSVPLGTLLHWIGSSDHIPSGYLLCDGTEHPKANYRALYDLLHAIRPELVDPQKETFRTPTADGHFLRVTTDESKLLSSNPATVGRHTHQITSSVSNDDAVTAYGWSASHGGGPGTALLMGSDTRKLVTKDDGSTGDETRPKNIQVFLILKATLNGEET